MDTIDTGMRKNRSAEFEVVEREPESVVLTRHWTDDGAMRHHRTRREWEELTKSGCSKDQSTFITQDSRCSSP
jgi:quinol monooxygenase YgiN